MMSLLSPHALRAGSMFPAQARINCNKFIARVTPSRQPMFKRRDDVMAVAAQGAMIAVMHHHDVTMRPARTRDARQALDQFLGRLRLPIPTDFRPHRDA